MHYCLYILMIVATIFQAATQAFAIPKVVTTIQPLHSLTSGVMGDIATPVLLIRGGQSPHNYSLRPSDAKALANADLIVWVGPELESFLVKPLGSIAGRSQQLSLLHQSELIRIPQRAGGVWNHREHDEHESIKAKERLESDNPHLWLDPQNAIRIVQLLAKTLAGLDPINSSTYHKNADNLETRLQELDQKIAEILHPIRNRPYLVFHDAYPYFEQRFNLSPIGSILVSPEHQAGAKRIIEIRKLINTSGASCVFAEPQFRPQLIKTLISGSSVKSGILDPLGSDLTPGPESYFLLIQQMADSLKRCLQDEP